MDEKLLRIVKLEAVIYKLKNNKPLSESESDLIEKICNSREQ